MARFLKYEIPTDKLNDLYSLLVGKLGQELHWVSNGELKEGLEAVDILWEDEPLQEMEQFEVYPNPCGVHSFLGCEGLYELEFNKHNNL